MGKQNKETKVCCCFLKRGAHVNKKLDEEKKQALIEFANAEGEREEKSIKKKIKEIEKKKKEPQLTLTPTAKLKLERASTKLKLDTLVDRLRKKEGEESLSSEEATEESEEDDDVSHFSREGGHKDDFLNNKTLIKDVPWKILKKRLLDKSIDIDEFYVSSNNFD